MSDRIRAIISDPDSSFTYSNISSDDMVSLEEMASQSAQFGTMKLVEADDDEKKAGAEATEKRGSERGTTSATATAILPGSQKAKPAEQNSEISDRTAPQSNADTVPRAI